MKKIFLLYSLLFISPAFTFGLNQDITSCDSPEAHQFDFWIGEWNINQKIIQKDGNWLETKAHTSVSTILNGCALEEHWKGDVKFFWLNMQDVKPMKGFSLRYYDEKEKNWHIYWLDNFNPKLGKGSTGNFKDGKGEFFSETSTPNGNRISRITFSDITDDSVHWDLAISNDDGKKWTTIWIMEMKRTDKSDQE